MVEMIPFNIRSCRGCFCYFLFAPTHCYPLFILVKIQRGQQDNHFVLAVVKKYCGSSKGIHRLSLILPSGLVRVVGSKESTVLHEVDTKKYRSYSTLLEFCCGGTGIRSFERHLKDSTRRYFKDSTR